MHEDIYSYGRNKVYIERYSDPRDLIETTKGREPPLPYSYQTETRDFIATDIQLNGDSWRGGYTNSADVMHVFEHGTTDRKTIEDAENFRLESTTTNTKKLAVRKPMVYGGAVHMGRYMTGNPQCMVAVRREKVPSRVLELAFDAGVSCIIGADDIRIIGLAILGAIARLESTGYKVRLHALSSTKLRNGNIIGCDLLLKDSSDLLSPTRVLFPIHDPAFERTVMFGWDIRNPHWDDSPGMGYPISYSIQDLDNFYKKTYGYDHVFSMQELAEEMRGQSNQDKARYIRDYIVNQLSD